MKSKNLEITEYFILGDKKPTDTGVADILPSDKKGSMYVDVNGVIQGYNGTEWKELSENVKGLDGELQLNKNGVLGTVPNLVWDDVEKELKIFGGVNLLGTNNSKIMHDGITLLSDFKNSFFGANSGTFDVAYTGKNNVSILENSLSSLTSGENNLAIGKESIKANTSGSDNIGLGFSSLITNTSGSCNIALGNNSLYSNTTGDENISIGSKSMFYNTIGTENVAIGQESLKTNTSGTHNIALNSRSLYSNTTGSDNIAIGNSSLYSNTTGNFNLSFGNGSLNKNTEGDKNIAIGISSLFSNISGKSNIAEGESSLYSNLTGSDNVVIGNDASYQNTSGSNNVVIGTGAFYKNTTGSNNIIIGNKSAYNEEGLNTLNDTLFISSDANGTSNPLIMGKFDEKYVKINNTLIVENQVKIGEFDTNVTPEPGMIQFDGSSYKGFDGTNWVNFTGEFHTNNVIVNTGSIKGLYNGSDGKYSYLPSDKKLITLYYDIKCYSESTDSSFFETGHINVKIMNNVVYVYDLIGQVSSFDNNFKNADGTSKLGVRVGNDSTDVYLELFGYPFSGTDEVKLNYTVSIKDTSI